MFILQSYFWAVIFCAITMLCWGSWANTQKLAPKDWRFELFYWDYVFGVVLAALAFAFTMGSTGDVGRDFLTDLRQADSASIGSALLGGVVFNAANILLVAAIALSGMAVAFPVGIGMALVLGVLINYAGSSGSANQANPTLLFLGVALVAAAIILDALAYRKLSGGRSSGGVKGLVLSILCGILMSLFYFLVARAIGKVEIHTAAGTLLKDVNAQNLQAGVIQAGKMTAYTANVVFAFGILLSSFVFNTAIMIKPFVGEPLSLSDYFTKGRFGDHLWGLIGGMIWAVGMTLNVVASAKASEAVAYGLGQGATMVAALWGVFIWREFRDAPRGTTRLLVLMFFAFIAGLALVILSRMS
jgi:glucose uptake protein